MTERPDPMARAGKHASEYLLEDLGMRKKIEKLPRALGEPDAA
jgi:hypothetical protein